ncbi:Dioxygenase [Planctomycetes bacterium Poly30]|uniref:Dioxygenase n=1 Tax=Saltatorellus ferox TaxID=2528018 RepID=A0A518EW06_9BACT|nr:Dioxygenase [Planctomycetes bacterium Poly30]
MKNALVASLCVVGLAAVLVWKLSSEGRAVEQGPGPAVTFEQSPGPKDAGESGAEVEELAVPDATVTRTDAGASPLSTPAEIPAGVPTGTVSDSTSPAEPWTAKGLVLDTGGAPVAGAEIVRRGKTQVLAVTGGDGRFEVTMESASAILSARHEGHRTVFAGAVSRHLESEEAVIMVARVVTLGGVVVSGDGTPVPGAAMSMSIPWRGLSGFPRSLERSTEVELTWSGNADGTFEIRDVPVFESAPLSTVADGFLATSTPVPEADDFSLVIGLRSEVDSEPLRKSSDSVFFGVVRDIEGQLVEGATIFLGDARTESDSSGQWELVRGQGIPFGTPLAAAHSSAGTALLPYDEAWNHKSVRVGPLDLQLQPNLLSIQGRVLDSEGRPLEGWAVELLNPTILDHLDGDSPSLESRASGRSLRDRTDERGVFKIGGLLERSYDVRAFTSPSYLSIVRPEVAAGTEDLELRLPADAAVEELHVRVVTREGRGVPGATVAARFILQRTRNSLMSRNGATGITDSEGRAVLNQVPRRGVDLEVSRPGIVTATLDPGDDGFTDEELEIEIERNLDVVIDCSGMSPVPKAVRILDGTGKRLMISSRTSRGSSSSTDLQLDGGLSAVVSVSEAAAELQILKDWEVVKRVPIQLAPDTINRIEVP